MLRGTSPTVSASVEGFVMKGIHNAWERSDNALVAGQIRQKRHLQAVKNSRASNKTHAHPGS